MSHLGPGVFVGDDHRYHLHVTGQAHAAHAARSAAHRRTSLPAKRAALPLEANSSTSLLPSVSSASTRASPSSSLIASLPRLQLVCEFRQRRLLDRALAGGEKHETILRCTRVPATLPAPFRPLPAAAGSRSACRARRGRLRESGKPLSQYTRPVLVKVSNVSWVLTTHSCSTTVLFLHAGRRAALAATLLRAVDVQPAGASRNRCATA